MAITLTGRLTASGSYSTPTPTTAAKQSQIYLIHPDGSGRKQLTHFKREHTSYPRLLARRQVARNQQGPGAAITHVFTSGYDGTI